MSCKFISIIIIIIVFLKSHSRLFNKVAKVHDSFQFKAKMEKKTRGKKSTKTVKLLDCILLSNSKKKIHFHENK